MQGCRRLSNSRPEIDGLDDLLMAPEQHLHDAAIERERRRSQRGYAAPADARAFLQQSRRPPDTSPARTAMNPIAAACFRDTAEDADSLAEGDIATSIDAVIDSLTDAGVMPERPPAALLEAADDDPRAARLPILRRLMAFVLRHDEPAYLARGRELAFLANTLLAGCSVQSRPFTPREASDAAASICNLGLECWPAALPDAFLAARDLVTVFEAGWSALYRDVSLFVADRLASTLADLDYADGETRRGLHALVRTLVQQRDAGAPWLARDAADVLATLDVAAWTSVLGLLDECPILPAALTAILERRTTSISPTAFAFISTTAQIGDIRVFVGMLPRLLSAP
jgi:hypothetical protein